MSRNALFTFNFSPPARERAVLSREAGAGGLLAAASVALLILVCQGVFAAASTNTAPGAKAANRVVVVRDARATEAFKPRAEVVATMFERGLTNLTGKASQADAWRTLVGTQDVVGIKVYSVPGPNSGTRAAVVSAMVEGLLAAGIPPRNIIVWDRRLSHLRAAGYTALEKRYGIRVCGSSEAGYDGKVAYESALIGTPVWGDLEFGKTGPSVGRRSFVSKLVTKEMTRIINVTPLLNHNEAGVSGNLFSLALGSVDNFVRFESDPDRLAIAIPEIYALAELSDRVVLNVVDALICQYEGGERALLHFSTMLNELRLSRDPVALDVLSVQELERQRKLASAPFVKANREIYSNAALLELGTAEVKSIQVETLAE